jgi:uncharacterized protein
MMPAVAEGEAAVSRVGWIVLGCVVLSGGVARMARAQQSGVDCHKATQWSDMMVCGNPDLTDLDTKVDKAYRDSQKGLSPKDAEEVRGVHEAWLRGREKCQEDPDPTKCLEKYYQHHIEPIVQPGQ